LRPIARSIGNHGVEHETVEFKFASLSAMVSRYVAPIAARRDLGGFAGNFKLSRISAATEKNRPNHPAFNTLSVRSSLLRSWRKQILE
jgi:hypothetical protein